ncbi:YidB family protein [Pantoea sp. BAV 3049]|uniref:YidB family protein n=1 Tax=Pantoea sp. BAV 3049 TaxID=2654188 RepID=UPI0018EEEDF5|nr:YidB family protein [Pantoea sp. BAV 3049]
MGIFGDLVGEVLTGGGQKADEITSVMSWVNQQGGLPTILAKLQQGEVGEVVKSWLSSGDNLHLSGELVTQALGSESVSQLADKLGIDLSQAAGLLAKYLPLLTDKASPDGELQQDALSGMLGKLLG